jgi:hypothetical protein
MASNTGTPAHASSSSAATAKSPASEAIVDLGKRLIGELKLVQSTDTLARWMVHYVAELITAAETATGDERTRAQEKCAAAILELWRHRHELPDGTRPFEHAAPVMRAIQALDPDDTSPRHWRTIRGGAEKGGDGETKRWLDTATSIDANAPLLVALCLVRAAGNLDDEIEWVKAARAADVDLGVEDLVINFVGAQGDIVAERVLKFREERIQERLARIAELQRAAQEIADHYETALAAARDGDGGNEEAPGPLAR